jgi:hypothetical protein
MGSATWHGFMDGVEAMRFALSSGQADLEDAHRLARQIEAKAPSVIGEMPESVAGFVQQYREIEGELDDFPSAEHKRLMVFVGRWKTEGVTLGDSTEEQARLRTTDAYTWMPGRHFLVHRVEGLVGWAPIHALEVIGVDPSGSGFVSHAFDNAGTIASYGMRLDGRRWEIRGDTERFDGEFTADHQQLTGQWDRKTDEGRWVPWMKITLTKQAPPARR